MKSRSQKNSIFGAMKNLLLSVVFVTTGFTAYSQDYKKAEDLIRKMHEMYYQAPCRSYIFSQKNTHYRNDSVSGHSVWNEAISFPDKFLISFGEPKEGNCVVFRNDSMYRFKKGAVVKTRRDTSVLLLLLGGMYYRDLPDVMERIQKAGFSLGKMSENSWQGEKVYVVGALAGDSTSNQVWISKNTLRVLRIIEKNGKEQMDMRFESHQSWCRGSVETKVSFRRNNVLEQTEEYYDIKEHDGFPSPADLEKLWPAPGSSQH
jgi:hypothetical protein